MTDEPVQILDEEYTKLVIQKCEENHIWLNKLIYLYPSDEQKIKLAESILDKLKDKSTQIPSDLITSESEVMREMAVLIPVLYLRVNWS